MTTLQNQNITGIILAGGKSSRMGQEKGLKLHNGIPFIQHIIKAIESVTKNILIITNRLDYNQFGYPCYSDIIPNKGPVGGIYTGLSNTHTTHNIVLSCDVPFVTSSVLENLVLKHNTQYDVVQYEETPLVALYHQSTIKQFLKSIEEDKLSLKKTLSSLKVKNIPIKESIVPLIKNINTPQQYNEAIQWN
ncbi:molybdenum cofactor guanylyltransferase [Aquimarina sp. 2201CG5-10]|uniref:molybdenum cofactor guanylyltransferase n=1 Tax=Aquimarina callyspongiae TaxID=3098150 RepID=UPI002AB4607B|nr:molybdenum cofactor guanylyltransferase [Aquimarina sp. 2201CG5-10]MDY8138156.1 molybdenum cofactor guanylyltransferase [Aquimarina sp. 2201CG5-10]